MMEPKAYDYIVVGSGSAGCAVAMRLVEHSSCNVLLIEAGRRSFSPWAKIPLGVGRLYNDQSIHWPFMTEPEPNLNGRRIYLPSGKILGGSSSINGLLFARGSPQEYDRLSESGCPGWSYSDVLPYFRRLEDYEGGQSQYRGSGGPISVSNMPHRDGLTEAFYQSCIDIGIPGNKDYNGETYEGVSYLQLTTNSGLRCSSATGYLSRTRSRSNFRLLTNTLVTKILFKGKSAIGVSIKGPEGSERKVYVTREVLLCAGAFGSPRLLELSGVGDKNKLRRAGVSPLHNLIGVGENLSDHLNTRLSYRCREPITINDALNNIWLGARLGLQYLFCRRGLMATPSVTVHALARGRYTDTQPNLKLQIAHLSGESRYSMTKETGLDKFSGFMLGSTPLYPSSRGSVHIRSNDPSQPPKIQANYLTSEEDLDTALSGVRLLRRISSNQKFQGLVAEEIRPGEHIQQDDELIDFIRSTAQTSWHPVGTCKMGSDARAVVDPELRVRGLSGLRVADASIFPNLISVNTNAPTIMVGERCADFVLDAISGELR